MKTSGLYVSGALIAALLAGALVAPQGAGGVDRDAFTLARAVPNDVFMFVAQRHNPEREFLDQYWGEVFQALEDCGIGDDLIELVGSALGTKNAAEVQRLKQRASELLAGVDWKQLAGKEMVFAERFQSPTQILGQRPPLMMADMVWMFRGTKEGAERNYEGLVAILEGAIDEINNALGAEPLAVEMSTRMGAKVASANMLAMVPTAPPLPIYVALRDDIVLIAVRENLFGDVLALLDEGGSATALADDPQFKAAFAKLPPAEDLMSFFDMQALLEPLRTFLGAALEFAEAPRDFHIDSGLTAEAGRLNARALAAYRRGDVKEALALIRQAHEAGPDSSLVLYNLACFNALCGNRDEALAFLEKAVDGGFCAPRKIASDPDLASLRREARYEAALARATQCAAERYTVDTAINTAKSGEAYRLLTQAWQVYQEKDYEQGLKLVEQAYAVAPKDSKVLYGLACFHALRGHEDKALDFLDEAVDAGFYCPRHIQKDPDLEGLRDTQRYEAAVARARTKLVELAQRKSSDELRLARQLIDRAADAFGVLDYSAAVETTDGYAVRAESITALVPDAEKRPIYPVFAKRQQLTQFDRFLPEETASFSVGGGLDLRELYKFAEDSLRTAGPLGEELLTKWTALQKKLGVDVRKDIVDWIDGDYVSVTLADGRGSVWLITVADEQVAREKVSAAIEFFSTGLMDVVAKNPALAGLAMLSVHTSPVENEQLAGFENLHFTVSPQPIVWGVTDGYLVVGTSEDAVALCLATARGEHPSIRSNARAMSEAIVPTGPFARVTLTDRRNLGEQLAAGIGIASTMCGMLGAFIPEPEARAVIGKLAGMLAKLTPVVRRIDFYKSAATCTTFDGRTWRYRTVTHYFSPEERAERNKE